MSLPDYVLDADAVLKDENVNWRHGRAPDYSKTRQIWADSKYFIINLMPYPWVIRNLQLLTFE
jgi:hypothetical protein